MNIPDPRHAAATAPIAAPAGPQWGGQAPSVIDPGLIAHLANSFFNSSPGQMADPQALATFAATQERPAAPPTSVPGATGAAAALPGTSVPGAQSVPFTTQIPVFLLDTVRAPAQHLPAAGLASGITGLPAGAAALPASPTAVSGPSAEKGQQAPMGYLDGAALRALPQTLGPLTALVPPAVPAELHGFPGLSALPAEAFYFLDGGSTAAAPTVPSTVPSSPSAAVSALGVSLPGVPSDLVRPRETLPSGAPGIAGVPAPHIEQSPTYGKSFPTEAELRPRELSGLNAFPSTTFPAGFSHETVSTGFPTSSGELNYFVNEAMVGSAPATASATAVESRGLAPAASKLEPALAPDFISGTRAFDAYAIKRDFPILHQLVHGKPLI